MRLIDADALMQNIPSEEIIAKMAVAYAPTIERKCGEWIEMYRNGFGNMICMCSKCNFHATRSRYCPNCGASMREREGE